MVLPCLADDVDAVARGVLAFEFDAFFFVADRSFWDDSADFADFADLVDFPDPPVNTEFASSISPSSSD